MSTSTSETVAPAARSASRGPATAVVLGRTCRAEWSRLWSVRSTWWFTLATAVAVLGIGVVLGVDVQGDPASQQPDGTAWRGGQITSVFGFYGLLALAVVAATADHTTGSILPTLQATPRRHLLLAGRTTVVIAVATVMGTALVAGSSAIVYAFAPEMGLPASTGADVLATVAAVHALCLLTAVGTSLALRNAAGSLVAVLALMLVLPMMLAVLPFTWSTTAAEAMPGSAAMLLLTAEGPVPLTDRAAWVSLGVWAGVAMAAGAVRLLRADADR